MHITTLVTILGFLAILLYLIAVHITLREQWEHTLRLNDQIRELSKRLANLAERVSTVEDIADLLNTDQPATPGHDNQFQRYPGYFASTTWSDVADPEIAKQLAETVLGRRMGDDAYTGRSWRAFSANTAARVTDNWPR